MCIVIVCFPGCDVIIFEINFIFLIMPIFCMLENSRQKLKSFEHEKSFLRWNRKHFASFWKCFQWSQILSDLRVGEGSAAFSKDVSSRERVKLWFFVTFNIIIRHILQIWLKFTKNLNVVQKIWKCSPLVLTIYLLGLIQLQVKMKLLWK